MKYFIKKLKSCLRKGPAPYETGGFRSGFVMLFAIVVSGIILAIALGVTNITLKELAFDTSAKNTNEAFFAADAGVECALFYDLQGENDTSAFGQPSAGLNTNCAGTDVDLSLDSSGVYSTEGPWTFYLYPLGASGNACAIVNVTKSADPEMTTIISKGYNLGGNTDNCTSTNPNRVEREILVTIGDENTPPSTNHFDLNIQIVGASAMATVTSAPSGISCYTNCFASFIEDTGITLTASALPGLTFVGWSGDVDCPGSGDCTFTLDENKNVVATYAPVTHDLDITLPTNGNITSNPGDIDCGSDGIDICTDTFVEDDAVVLTADPDPGYTATWTGACSGFTYPATCNLTMDTDKTASATFSLMSMYPQVATDATTSIPASEVHLITLPAGIESQDLLIIFTSLDANISFGNWPAGWTPLVTGAVGTNKLEVRYKIADGSEGANMTLTTTGNAQPSAHHVVRIQKNTYNTTNPVATSTTNLTLNPNSLDPSTWGTEKTLWFAVNSRNNGSNSTSTPGNPANYTNLTTVHAPPGDTNGTTIVTARREREVASEDPGAFVIGGIGPASSTITATIAVQGL